MVNVPFGPSTEFFWAELALSLVEFISADSRRERTHKKKSQKNKFSKTGSERNTKSIHAISQVSFLVLSKGT